MEDVVQVKAVIPRALKRQFSIRLLQRDEKFNAWLRHHIETWLAETSHSPPTEGAHAGCTPRGCPTGADTGPT